MSDVPRFSEALEGYADLASRLVDAWTPYLTGVASKVGSGTYTAADASSDFPVVAKLITRSVIAVGSEGIDAVAILTQDFDEEVVTGFFHTDVATSGPTRTLALRGDLVSATGAVLPKDSVTIEPATLGPHVTKFALRAEGDGMKARTYDGWVAVTDPTGVEGPDVFVSVTVG